MKDEAETEIEIDPDAVAGKDIEAKPEKGGESGDEQRSKRVRGRNSGFRNASQRYRG